MWEKFFNWQSDMDWTWGPFLRLRPPPEMPMQPWVWVRLFAVLSLAGLSTVGGFGVIAVLGPGVAARQHWILPPSLAETLVTLGAIGADTRFRLLLIALVLSLPLLFFAACWPFHAAWNRRAARLSAEPKTSRPEAQAEQTEVWPPAPNQS